MSALSGFVRSPRLRAMLVSIALVLAPLGLTRVLEPWLGPADHLVEVTILALPAALVAGAWLGWRVVRPLEKLEAQVRRKTDTRADLDLDRSDEYARLTGAMNALLARLEARQRAHEAFVADTVHALKSPLAAVQLAAEQLGREASPLEPQRRERLSRALAGSAARLDEITVGLLDLARAEAGLPGELRVQLDLAAQVRALAERASSDGRWPQVAVGVEAPDAIELSAVELRVRAAIEALLDNARSFARARVTLRVEQTATHAIVEVHDDGPGIASADHERVFERFVTQRQDGSGSGIGLALARAVAEAHGGSVRVIDGGLRLELGRTR